VNLTGFDEIRSEPTVAALQRPREAAVHEFLKQFNDLVVVKVALLERRDAPDQIVAHGFSSY
jgi:hypothetical protein